MSGSGQRTRANTRDAIAHDDSDINEYADDHADHPWLCHAEPNTDTRGNSNAYTRTDKHINAHALTDHHSNAITARTDEHTHTDARTITHRDIGNANLYAYQDDHRDSTNRIAVDA